MPIRETCGNDYDKTFRVMMNGQIHVFDSFEYAIKALARTCVHCGTRILGHGLEKSGIFFCCKHGTTAEGFSGLCDRM